MKCPILPFLEHPKQSRLAAERHTANLVEKECYPDRLQAPEGRGGYQEESAIFGDHGWGGIVRQRTVTVGFKALLLVGALLVTAPPIGASEPWEVRVVSVAEYDVAGPFGLSYSEADKSLLLVSHSGAQPVVTAIDLEWDLVKSTAIDRNRPQSTHRSPTLSS